MSLGSRKNKKVFKIHRCVAETFIPNPNHKPEINHIDGNKSNNNVENLEFVTSKENTQHAYRIGLAHGKRGENGNAAKLKWTDIEFIRSNYIPKDHKYGTRGLARMFNVNHTTIMDVINNNTWIA